METPWSVSLQMAGRSSLEDWLANEIFEQRGLFHFNVIRSKDLVAPVQMAQLAGEIDGRMKISKNAIGRAMHKIGCKVWESTRSRWWIIRDERHTRSLGPHYWRAVFAVTDIKGVEAAIRMTPLERSKFCMETRPQTKVIDFPYPPKYEWE